MQQKLQNFEDHKLSLSESEMYGTTSRLVTQQNYGGEHSTSSLSTLLHLSQIQTTKK